MTTTYTVHGYDANDTLAHTVEHVEALDALRAAYAWAAPMRVAHIVQDGTTGGIYVARSGDLQRATLGECLQALTRPGRFS